MEKLGGTQFIEKMKSIVEEHLDDDQFGVSDLADKAMMSRSNLFRKIKKATNLSVSQFIREIRLEHAMKLIEEGSLNVSEIAFQVGFGSTSYFIKCFREKYGHPPGEVANREEELPKSFSPKTEKQPFAISLWAWIAMSLSAIAVFLFFVLNTDSEKPNNIVEREQDKSIAVLPFKNDSNDSTNVYFINGLMESILNKLQNINDLRVVSRTSVERFRSSQMLLPDIAEALNVSYIVEGSGQKVGNRILLHVQLIEASNDRHVWAESYERETQDIFEVQNDIARKITKEIGALITPDEGLRLTKKYTEDVIAYDYFVRGLELTRKGTREELLKAIPWFEKAVNQDKSYARAYAALSVSYYYLDALMADKIYIDDIKRYADLAIKYDPDLAQSSIARALYYLSIGDYGSAISHLERALENNPNSVMALNTLSDLYATKQPDAPKYLQYALRGVHLDAGAQDSLTNSFVFLHVANALIQTGFTEEAIEYIDRAMSYSSDNLFAQYVRAYILYAQHEDLGRTKVMLLATLQSDTTRIDIIQEVAKMCYFMRDYEEAHHYYRKYLDIKRNLQLSVYPGEDVKIALVMDRVGRKEEAQNLIQNFKEYVDQDESIYKHLSLAAYHSYMGADDLALDHLRQFAKEDNYHYWTILFLDVDPIFDQIRTDPVFREIYDQLQSKFWSNHKKIRASLEEKRLI